MPQSERERDDEPDPVALAQRQGQDALDLLGLEWVDFGIFDTWRLGQGDGIAGDVAALEGLAEGGASGAVYLVCGCGLESAGQHLGVQLLEVFGLDAVDPVSAKTGGSSAAEPLSGSRCMACSAPMAWRCSQASGSASVLPSMPGRP